MSRIELNAQDRAQKAVDSLCLDMSRRLEATPIGNCPVDMTAAFLRLCLAQSCGKCAPCRIGLDKLYAMIENLLEGNGGDIELIEKTAVAVADSADCAIGFEAAHFVLDGIKAFRDDYVSHAENGRCTKEFKSVPCVHNCPAHVDIPAYIACTGEGRYADAVRVIRKDNPFPSVCALICEHPCEHHCRRTIVDDAVNIRGIKRFAIDNAGVVPAPKAAPATGKTVAVIGGGPAGLTAAYFLSLMGHKVTVFEARKRLGGMLRYGIPCYRLPDSYLDADIDIILSLGVEVKLETKVGKDVTMEELRKNYDSVYVSIGAHTDKKLGIEGEDKAGVISAVDLLRGIGDGDKPDFTGKNVVIVGGGNVAMDVTRTSMRLGAKSVSCVYRRRVSDMTALPEEVEGAVAEGCEVMPLLAPVRVTFDENDNVTGLVVQPQMIGEYDRGRPKPCRTNKPEVTLPADIIIVAIGQDIEAKYFEEQGMATKWNTFLTEASTAVKGLDGVFAGGDCVSGPATVIRAIEAGKVTAANIDEYLGTHTDINLDVDVPIATYKFKPACGRVNMLERDAAERKGDFELMEKGMSCEEAKQECSRCLRCDHYGMGAMKGGRTYRW